jgi:hypothetical protein
MTAAVVPQRLEVGQTVSRRWRSCGRTMMLAIPSADEYVADMLMALHA